MVEVNDIQTNGVQFWISVTNAPGTTNFVTGTNGCLFANLVDTTNGSHFIFSAPGFEQVLREVSSRPGEPPKRLSPAERVAAFHRGHAVATPVDC